MIFIVLLLVCSLGHAQSESLWRIWQEVKQNNLTASAWQATTEAEKISARTSILPENPEVEFAYMWGNEVAGSNRINVSVKQSFDFPSAYVYRKRIADKRTEQVDFLLEQQYQSLFLEVAEVYYDILYQNVRISDMRKCMHLLSQMVNAYEKKLQAGLATHIEYNKVRLSELNMRQQYKHAIVERDNQLMRLQQLNGDKPIVVEDTIFQPIALMPDFETWFQTIEPYNPFVQGISMELAMNEQQLKLDKSLWAPQFFVGYLREQVFQAEMFQGVNVGLSLPLWHNKNSIKQTQLRRAALNKMLVSEQTAFRTQMRSEYETLSALVVQIAEYEKILKDINSYEMLWSALQKGEISLSDYLLENMVYHDSHEQLFELYRDACRRYITLQFYSYLVAQ